jgi:flagellar basal body rod protein FlgG
LVSTNCVRQGYVESSNVQLDKEYMEVANYKRSFEANRQMFKIQNSNLSSAISKLGQV